MSHSWHFETECVHAGASVDPETGAVSAPIVQSAAYVYETAEAMADVFSGKKFGYLYSRISNPTVTQIAQRCAAIDQGLGSIMCASGLAAIAGVILALCESGDEIVVSQCLFGGTLDLFEETVTKMGIRPVYVDPTQMDQVRSAISDQTRLIFVESISNPSLDVPDITLLSALAQEHQIPLAVDTTLTPRYLFDAKACGVDIVLYSGTKYLSGNTGVIAGVVTDTGHFNWKETKSTGINAVSERLGRMAFLEQVHRHAIHNIGATLSAQSAFLLGVGLETMGLRLQAHVKNAQCVAEFLQGNSRVKQVNYPGLSSHPDYALAKRQFPNGASGLLTMELHDQAACYRFIDGLKLIKPMVNLGDTRSLAVHPASTIYHRRSQEAQAKAGVTPGLIRFSIGIENASDIISDIDQALKGV